MQHVAYRKTGLEWEILGDLGMRLHHKEEAKEAYQRCLDSQRYSIKPWLKLMEMYADEGDLQRTLQTAIRVAAYQHKCVLLTPFFLRSDESVHVVNMQRRLYVFLLLFPSITSHRFYVVPDVDRAPPLQARASARAPKDHKHAPEHGPPGPCAQGDGAVLKIRLAVQGRRA